MKRIALIIAGGSGERFWPLSRPSKPKQLLSLTGSGKVMLEETVARVEPVFGQHNIFVITSKLLAEPIREQLPWLAGQVLEEPDRRNSSGGIVWGMGLLSGLLGTKDLSFAILPSDHQIHPVGRYRAKVSEAIRLAETGKKLVTIGVPPTRAETGYGYLECGAPITEDAFEVARFIEKPSREAAEELIARKGILWNSGTFFCRYDVFASELAQHSPVHADALEEIRAAVSRGSSKDAEDAFAQLPNISIDYALMERTKAAAVVEADFEWDDLGAWDALCRTLKSDPEGNTIQGPARAVDSSNCLVYNSTSEQVVHLLGAHDLIVVCTDEAILVCPKDRAQDVKKLAT